MKKTHLRMLLICSLLIYTLNIKVYAQNKAKNIIVMIADGWGYNHIAMAESFTGTCHIYRDFPIRLSMSTYMAGGSYDSEKAWSDFAYVTRKYTDSAASATAMSCGEKTYNGAIGYSTEKKQIQNFIEKAQILGKSTGVVTSVPFSHATPAGFSVHNENRYNYNQIGLSMLLDSKLTVAMGAGHPNFDENGIQNPKYNNYSYVGGIDSWGNITQNDTVFSVKSLSGNNKVQDIDGDAKADAWTLISSIADFTELSKNPNPPKRILGIAPVRETLFANRKGNKHKVKFHKMNPKIPNLTTMSAAALNVLNKNEKGFVVMIEGGAIDWTSHGNSVGRLIEEMIDFEKAVKFVCQWIEQNNSWNETLLIVTGDHECGYLTNPYFETNTTAKHYPIKKRRKHKIPNHKFNVITHTNQLIPFFAKGANCKIFNKYADEYDSVRNAYIDNTEIAKVIFKIMK